MPKKKILANPGDEPASSPQEFSIVAIGASAGGLEACSSLLKQLPPDTGLAFVVVQHLDPAHESLLPTLLARVTKIPVQHVKNDVTVEPNHVYVMPSNSEMLFSDGKLHLIPRNASTTTARRPIDGFFRSLAENCQHHAIGVILSGTGSDGAMGLDMIKTAGGFTFAQDSQSARFEGMPNSAFATGSVDFVLPPEGIAKELIRISKHPYAKRVDGLANEKQPRADTLGGILALLQKASGVDFSRYRTTTVQRRILRRMAIHHIPETETYRVFLEKTPAEARVLCEEMIPRITRFFRDPNVFVTLKNEVFAKMVGDRPTGDAPIRIWVPGCASGEEVYAIAICLLEFCEENKTVFPIQIFGTDLSALAIQTARQGLYPLNIAEDVSPERLQRFFRKQDSGYQITTSVREKCIFANHDLIGDPPYSKLDLISCRNVLIYLDSLQTRVLPMFHYALKPSGFLVLGSMESARRFADLFAPVGKASQIYSKKPVSQRELHSWGLTKAKGPGKAPEKTDVWNDGNVQKRADQVVLARYAPGGVVVNENWQVLQVRGKVTPYLEAAPGKMSVSVLAMAKRSGLSQDLAAALNQAKKDNVSVRREKLAIPHEQLMVNLQVFPLPEEGAAPAYLILFEEVPASDPAPRPGEEGESVVAKDDFVRMQEELIATRERLVTMVENYQQYTEDTQSVQEESLSNLEEIQSFNEELETTKEELQSSNEELNTVNDELQVRNHDLQQARDFTTSIVETVQQPLMVLDDALCVKTANPSFYKIFHLSRAETEGRLLYDLAEGAWNTPQLRAMLENVLPHNQPFESFELSQQFPKAGRKILLISARRLNLAEMILLSIEDATALRRAQDELRQGQKMEAIGRLAGGVAHDFNNMLTGILGFSDLLQEGLKEGSEAWEQAAEIKKAGERASALTHQLLAFSRRQLLRPKCLDLNDMVSESDKMLHRLIGEDIGLVAELHRGLWPVLADPGQISQVIINLALNARDAMPHGGMLTIRTENLEVVAGGEQLRGLKPGSYVTLSISDSGSGMDPETQQHVFEPFFTTKPPGSGTGLGLATVFGIVEQSGGSIKFSSEMGLGSTFWIDLPKADMIPALSTPGDYAESPRGTETLLVVEDEEIVRRLAVLALTRLGYNVLDAEKGSDGLALCRSHPSGIDLMLTDVVMPGGMNGRELAEQAVAVRPKMKVVLMSGHTTDALVHYGVKQGSPFLQKPFMLNQLARKIREVLDA